MKSFFLSVGDPDRKDFLQGYTALHYAAKEDHLECLELLLEAGGDYNITNNNGTTCLDISKFYIECVHTFQNNGA
jgi:ankyrin repeat protein